MSKRTRLDETSDEDTSDDEMELPIFQAGDRLLTIIPVTPAGERPWKCSLCLAGLFATKEQWELHHRHNHSKPYEYPDHLKHFIHPTMQAANQVDLRNLYNMQVGQYTFSELPVAVNTYILPKASKVPYMIEGLVDSSQGDAKDRLWRAALAELREGNLPQRTLNDVVSEFEQSGQVFNLAQGVRVLLAPQLKQRLDLATSDLQICLQLIQAKMSSSPLVATAFFTPTQDIEVVREWRQLDLVYRLGDGSVLVYFSSAALASLPDWLPDLIAKLVAEFGSALLPAVRFDN